MKTTYAAFIALSFGYFSINAQLTLTKAANEPVSGDVARTTSYDSTSAVPKNTGINQTWSFSSMSSSGGFTETVTYTTVASTPGAATFTNATLAAVRGSNNYDYYRSNGNNWELVGFYESANDMLVISNTAVFAVWPISYGSTNTDMASGVQTSMSGSAAVTATISYVAAGTGTVTLPGGIMHTNCLQVIESLTVSTGTGAGAETSLQKTYRYYSSTKKFPIAEIMYVTEISGTVTSNSFNANIDNSVTIVGLGDNTTGANQLKLFPVPAADVLNLELPESKSADTIEIYDLNGRLLARKEHAKQLDVSGLPQGFYVVKVRAGEQLYNKILTVSSR